ncbi:MAG: hypothetical protein WCZ89_06795 [Phycisphaerae bacterium]
MKPQKKFLKSILILCVLCTLCLLPLTGCEQTSEQRVAEVKRIVDNANAISSSLETSISQLEPVITNLQAVLDDPNVPEDIKAVASKTFQSAQQRLSQLKAHKLRVDAALVNAESILDAAAAGDVGITEELQTYGSLITAAGTYVPQPIGGYLYLGGTLLTALGGLVGSILTAMQKNKELEEGQKTLTEVVISVDKLLGSPVVSDAEQAKSILEKAQSGTTQNAVDAIHQPAR